MNRKGFTLIELMIVIAIIAVIAAIAIPSLMRNRLTSNEVSAVASIRTIATGQNNWRASDYDKNGFYDYTWAYRLLYYQLVAGIPVAIIDRSIADASGAAGISKNGYLFGDCTSDATTGLGYSWQYEYGLSAWPVKYNKSGIRSFVTNESGTIFGKDCLAGLPITIFPSE